ncbi:PD40 domain-containing protein [bacterium]|nr:PD40 domain-containing protein [bacterium]
MTSQEYMRKRKTHALNLLLKTSMLLTFLISFISCDWLGGDDHSDPGTQIPNTELFSPLQLGAVAYSGTISPDRKSLLLVNNEFADTIGTLMMDMETYEKKEFSKDFLGTADWSPDGEWIVYTDYSKGRNIFKIKSNGDSITQLTFEGNSIFPRWSPDGEKIVYVWSVYPEGGVHLMDKNGNGKSFLFVGTEPSWSNSGDKIIGWIGLPVGGNVFLLYNFSQSRVVDTLKVMKGESNREPQYSPDGKRVLFWNDRGTYLMDSNGRNIRTVFKYSDNPEDDFDWGASWYSNNQVMYSRFRVTRYIDNNFGGYIEGYSSLYIKHIN